MPQLRPETVKINKTISTSHVRWKWDEKGEENKCLMNICTKMKKCSYQNKDELLINSTLIYIAGDMNIFHIYIYIYMYFKNL